jgi:hypothetical protein
MPSSEFVVTSVSHRAGGENNAIIWPHA